MPTLRFRSLTCITPNDPFGADSILVVVNHVQVMPPQSIRQGETLHFGPAHNARCFGPIRLGLFEADPNREPTLLGEQEAHLNPGMQQLSFNGTKGRYSLELEVLP